MDEIILVGAGGHARVCIEVIEQGGQYKIAGLVEKYEIMDEKNLEYPIIGIDEDLETLRDEYSNALVTIGQIKTPEPRINIYNKLKNLEYKLPVIISPLAYISKYAEICEGTAFLHGAIVNAGANIGINCIINNKALIEHDAIIGDHCHIATGAILNGETQVGDGTFIGSGVITKQSIKIGKNCVVGAGCVVKKNMPDNQTVS